MGEAPQGLRRLSCYRPGARPPGKTPARGAAVAEMLFNLEAARALYYRAISEEGLDPSVEAIQRARAAHVQVQRGAYN